MNDIIVGLTEEEYDILTSALEGHIRAFENMHLRASIAKDRKVLAECRDEIVGTRMLLAKLICAKAESREGV